jgi:hypothetical protein
MDSFIINVMNVLMFVVVPIAIIYATNVRKDREFRITASSNRSSWLTDAERRFLNRPYLRDRPFFSGTLSGIFVGIKLAFCVGAVLTFGLAEEWITGKHGINDGVYFFLVFISAPWPAYFDSTLDPRWVIASGIGVNIGLLGLAKGIYEAIESRI